MAADAKTETTRIKATPGAMSEEEAIKWTNAQLSYPNLAGNKKIAERAVSYVTEIRRHYTDKMQGMWRRWRANNYMLLGNTLNVGLIEDLHVPELYKAVETLVPRIEEAMHEPDPWFRVRGRDKDDRIRAEAIAALLQWQLEQTKWRKKVSSSVRDLLIYQCAVLKVRWDRRVKERVKHTAEVEYDDLGDPIYKHVREKRREVVFDGPRLEQIDPFDFIVDTRAAEVEDASYIGDRSEWRLADLLAMQRQGFLMNVDQVVKQNLAPDQDGQRVDWNKWSRSLTERYGYLEQLPSEAPKKFKVVDLWCKFDLYDDGEERDCVLTVLEDRICLQVRENPYDSKMAPYAVARVAKNGHEFFNIGVLDNAVRINVEYDRHRMNVLRAHDISVSQIFLAEDESDLPDTLYDVPPGSVFKGVGKVTPIAPPDTLRSAPYIDSFLRRDIEETVGVARPQMGSDSGEGNTATEFMGLMQEGNRRLKGVVTNYADMWADGLSIMHKLNGQFLVGKTSFRVLGKRAKLLGEHYAMGPDVLLEDVDFEFVGPRSLHTYGTRATGLMNFVQTFLPVMQQYPEDIDMRAIMREAYGLIVGTRHEDDVIKVPTPIEQLMDQDEENGYIMQGIPILVDELDNDEEHLAQMQQAGLLDAITAKGTPRAVRQAIMKHASLHLRQLKRKQVQEQARRETQQQRMDTLPPEAGGQAGPTGASPQAGGLSAALTPTGETPGPGRPETTGTAGRGPSGVEQTRNLAG